jgi:type II secretory pathway pseudopilin PulG
MSKKQNGFTVVEGLLVLVIIGLIGFVGWYVWNAKDKTDKNLNSAASTSASADKTAANKLLTVKELGLRIPLSSSINNLFYTYDTTRNNQNTGIRYIHFWSVDFTNPDSPCAQVDDVLGIYSVYDSAQKSDVGGLVLATTNRYIYHQPATDDCINDPKIKSHTAEQTQALLNAVQQAKFVDVK